MTYDSKVPTPLKETQQWFGSIIARPVDGNSCMDPISPSGQPIQVEASQYIRPSPTLQPAQRIQIYNQQYWWRLLNALQESFPLVTRLFGCHDFNISIGMPYLQKYPPCHWTLNVLGDNLPAWVEEYYSDDDRKLIRDAALIDCAFCHSFTAAH
ncbi:MAG: DNA-binding domain-containing protein, partial [Parachlamydia sp.]|nr:DNA-binding domain-containing protein [Parachlamydia sp.]